MQFKNSKYEEVGTGTSLNTISFRKELSAKVLKLSSRQMHFFKHEQFSLGQFLKSRIMFRLIDSANDYLQRTYQNITRNGKDT